MICLGCGRENARDDVPCTGCGRSPHAIGSVPPPSSAPPVEDEHSPTIATDSLPEELRSDVMASYDALKPGAKIGERYEIVSVLGMGGMGVVYRARDLTLGRDVALKVIRPEMTKVPGIMERFRREILLASKVTHRNILRIHDLGETDGLSYISMNFVEGETLRDVMDREGTLDPERVLPIVVQLCEALKAAHEAGVVHRDLKPQNVLFDQGETVYIADFGLSRSLDADRTMTQTGMILGTIDYMSPEQARGETPDHRTDIYSLGIIVYEMLSGELPFRAGTAISSMMQRIREDVPRLGQKVPSWLASIVARALMREPDDRYASASEILRDLEARRASMAWRRLRKPRFLIRAAAAVLALTLIGVGGVVGIRYLLKQGPGGTVAVQASLAVLPFHNATGDPSLDWIRTGLPDLLRTDLQQSRALRVVGADRLQLVVEGLKLGPGGEFRDDEIRRASGVLGVDNLLVGTLLRAGDRFRLEATVRRVVGDSVTGGAPLRVDGEGADSIFAMMDALSLSVREDLGVGKRWRSGAPELSTRSPEALRLYGEGVALTRGGEAVEAAVRLEEAVQADPGFALAAAALAEIYDGLGHSVRAKEASAAAAAGLPQATPYEAARIRAIQARVENDLGAARAAYRRLTELLPNSTAARFDLASVLEEQGELEEAAVEYGKVLELDAKHPSAHFALGRVLVKSGDPSAAVGRFNTALALHRELRNDEGRAVVLNGLGIASDDLGDYDAAMRYYQEALQIHEAAGNQRGAGSAHNNIAVVLMTLGRNDEALEEELKAIAAGEEIGDRTRLGEWHSNLGDIYQELGKPDEALASYRESLRLVREAGEEAALPWTLSNIGFINTVLGNYLEAFFFQKAALEKSRELGETADLLQALIGMGFVEQVQGRYEEALKYHLEGLGLAREGEFQEGIVVFLVNMANAQEDQGEYGSALRSLAEAERLARELGDADLLARCLTYVGGVRRRIGELDGAGTAMEEALELIRELQSPELVALIQSNRGALLRDRGHLPEAAAALGEAREAADAARNHRLGILVRLHAAELARSSADLRAATADADESGLAPLAAQGHLAQAELHLDGGDAEAAARSAGRAIQIASALHARDLLLRAHDVAARAESSRGRADAALDHYARGLASLEEIRADLSGEERAVFLARPATARFARDAGEAFTAGRRPSDADRLAAATVS